VSPMRKAARPRRTGLATLDVVLSTALTLPMAAFLLFLLERLAREFVQVVGTTVGSPYL
jgi:hypothetical protein